jgi:hypothetical protein
MINKHSWWDQVVNPLRYELFSKNKRNPCGHAGGQESSMVQ